MKKSVVSIVPVHPFSARILVRKYGREDVEFIHDGQAVPVLQVPRTDPLSDALNFGFSGRRKKVRRRVKRLTHKVAFLTGRPLRNVTQLGAYLFRCHKQELFNYVHAQLMGRQFATTAIASFCYLYGITDAEADLDSLNRQWRAYKRENPQLFGSNIPKRARKNVRLFFENGQPLNPLSKTEIEQLVAGTVNDSAAAFINTKKQFDVSLVRQALAYAFYDMGKLKLAQIAKLTGIDPSTAHYRVKQFENVLDTCPEIAEAYQNHTKAYL